MYQKLTKLLTEKIIDRNVIRPKIKRFMLNIREYQGIFDVFITDFNEVCDENEAKKNCPVFHTTLFVYFITQLLKVWTDWFKRHPKLFSR